MMKHDSVGPLRSIPRIRRILAAVSIVLSVGLALAAFGSPVNDVWTYQGQLRRGGAAYNGTCNFLFSLWDAETGGTQNFLTQISSVSVTNGLFTVQLGDTGILFNGDARWLGVSVQCSGDGGFTPLDPRQPITAAPYALSLQPGALIINESGTALRLVMSGSGASSALSALNTGTGDGVNSGSALGNGVFGSSSSGNGAGVFGINSGSGTGIRGENTGSGWAGQFVGPVDVAGSLNVHSQGNAISGTGVYAVSGISDDPNGLGVNGYATGANAAGVFGQNSTGAGVWGKSTGAGSAIYGQNTGNGFAGRFTGPVLVEGNLIVQGTLSKPAGSFRIDHPLDPANKFLSHSFVESPDMMNIYNGVATLDAQGQAVVTLPDYFEALNRDFRYQLTCIGGFAPVYVAQEINQNQFRIDGGTPGLKVSWQITGIRQDAYAQAKPIVVEESKPAEEQGLYLFPAGFGAGEEKRIGHLSQPAPKPGAQDPSGAIPANPPANR